MDFYLSSNSATRKVIDWSEWILLVAVGGIIYNPRLSDSIVTFSTGIIFIVAGIWMHSQSHKVHSQAHDSKERIFKIITTGIYSKIRHPGYLGYLLGYIGVFFAIGSYSILIVSAIYTISFLYSIREEEKYLTIKFGQEYEEYKKETPWKLIPYVF
jgi:protein-S-isoprenylcysteine O-methyltransferase Ste14